MRINQPRTYIVRTIVIAGTATAMSTAIWRRHSVRHVDRLASPQADPPLGGITVDQLDLLERLGALRKAEVLSTEEFEAQKDRILRSTP